MADINTILEAIQKRRSFGEKLADKMGGEPLLKQPDNLGVSVNDPRRSHPNHVWDYVADLAKEKLSIHPSDKKAMENHMNKLSSLDTDDMKEYYEELTTGKDNGFGTVANSFTEKPKQEIQPVSKTFEQKASQDIQNFRDKVEDGESLQKPPISEAQRRFMAIASKGEIPGVSKKVGQEFMAEDKGEPLPERAEKVHPMPVPLRDSASLPENMEKSVVGKLKAMVPLASLACGAGGCGSKVEQSGNYCKTSVEGHGTPKTECYKDGQKVSDTPQPKPDLPNPQATPDPKTLDKANDTAGAEGGLFKMDDSNSEIDTISQNVKNSGPLPQSNMPHVPPLNTNPNTQPAPAPAPTTDQRLASEAFGSAPAGLQKASPTKVHEDKSIKEANGTQEAADVKAGPLNATKLKAIIESHKSLTSRLKSNFNPSVAREAACEESYIDRAKEQEKSGTGAGYLGEDSGKSPEKRSEELHEKKEKMYPQMVEPKTKELKKAFDEKFYDKTQRELKYPKMSSRELINKFKEGRDRQYQGVADDDVLPDAKHSLPASERFKTGLLEHSADFPPTGMSKIHDIINKVKGKTSAEHMEKGTSDFKRQMHVNAYTPGHPQQALGTQYIGRTIEEGQDMGHEDIMDFGERVDFSPDRIPNSAKNRIENEEIPRRPIQAAPSQSGQRKIVVRRNQPTQNSGSSLQKAKELLAGGLADGRPDSSFSRRSLREGQKVEQEHTSNPQIAKEIAKDHLAEHGSQYYPKLKQMEGKMEKASDSPEVKREGKDNSKVVGKVVIGEKGEWHWAKEGEEGIPVRKQHGYYRITGGEYRGRYLHSIVAEKRMGRKLKDGEEVDHVNGDRSDTKNLKVLSIGEHTSKTNKTRGDEGSGPKKYAHSKDDNHKKMVEKSDLTNTAPSAAPDNVVMGIRG